MKTLNKTTFWQSKLLLAGSVFRRQVLLLLVVAATQVVASTRPIRVGGFSGCIMVLRAYRQFESNTLRGENNVDSYSTFRSNGRDILVSFSQELRGLSKGKKAASGGEANQNSQSVNPKKAALLEAHIKNLLQREQNSSWSEGGKLLDLMENGGSQVTMVGIKDPKAIDDFLAYLKNASHGNTIPNYSQRFGLTLTGNLLLGSPVILNLIDNYAQQTSPSNMTLLGAGLIASATLGTMLNYAAKISDQEDGAGLSKILSGKLEEGWEYAEIETNMYKGHYDALRLGDKDIPYSKEVIPVKINIFHRKTPTPELALVIEVNVPPENKTPRRPQTRDEEEDFALEPELQPLPIRSF